MSENERESLLCSRSASGSYQGIFYRSNRDLRSRSRSCLPSQTNRHLIPGVLVLLLVVLERISFYSLTANLYLFLNQRLYSWMSYNAMSALLIFTGVTYVSSLFGGMLADSLLGRYKTIGLGLLLFTAAYWFFPFLSSYDYAPQLLNKCNYKRVMFNASDAATPSAVPEKQLFDEPCCEILLSLIIISAIGTGTVKANIAPFGAEQVRCGGPDHLRTYLTWFYWCVNFGAFVAVLGIAYVQQALGFFLGYLMPACCILLATILFFCTYFVYNHEPPTGSAITRIMSIIKEAFKSKQRFKSRRNQIGENSRSSEMSSVCPSFLDMAKVKYGGKFHESAVEDVKAFRTIIIVFAFLIPYWLLYFQMQTTFLAQGLHMRLDFSGSRSVNCSDPSTSFYMPAAWLTLFDIIFLIIFIPLLDRIIYPFLDKHGMKIPMLCRMIIGMCFATLSVLIAGLLEQYRRTSVNSKAVCQIIENTAFYAADLSILWQIPQYSLMGISEVFTSVAGMEFACSQAPSSIQSAIMGLFYFFAGIGSLLGTVLLITFENVDGILLSKDRNIGNINYGHLEYFFFLLAGIQCITLIIFSFISPRLKIRKMPLASTASFSSRFNYTPNETNSSGSVPT